MTRNRFLKICRFIPFQDNKEPDKNDRIWKIRSWIAQLPQNLERIPPGEHQSVDEIMVAFKGKSTLKQYIRNKPHKWGLKLGLEVKEFFMILIFTQAPPVPAQTDLNLG